MALLFSMSIDCSKITKSKLEKGKYLKVTGRISDEPSQFNTNVALFEDISKEQKDAGHSPNYIANGRVVWKDDGEIPVVKLDANGKLLEMDHEEERKAARKKTSAPKLSEPVSEEEEEMDELPF